MSIEQASLPTWRPRRVSLKSISSNPSAAHRVIRIAHRGASAYAQENSLAAFHKAADMQADMVEVDIRLTADGVPIVAHDDNLLRIFGVEGNVTTLTLAEIGHLTPADREPIPTFAQVAATCAALKLGLYLDIKQLDVAGSRAIFEALSQYSLTEQTIFGSFRPDWLADIRAFVPDALTSILFHSIHIDPVALARAVRCDYVHPCWEDATPEPHKLLTLDWLQSVRAAGLGIVCWHEERPQEISALYQLGVDAVCSDTPDLLFKLASTAS